MVATLSLEQLKSCLRYDHETGWFTHLRRVRSRGGSMLPGQLAGNPRPDGYILVGVLGKQYRAHRLAWFYMTGEWPPKGLDIDHKNRDRADNRWANLRLRTRGQNNHNSGASISNMSGHKGVSFNKGTGKWLARIQVEKRIIHLGYYPSKEEAAAARTTAEAQYLAG
jgi:hypothetical protein